MRQIATVCRNCTGILCVHASYVGSPLVTEWGLQEFQQMMVADGSCCGKSWSQKVVGKRFVVNGCCHEKVGHEWMWL